MSDKMKDLGSVIKRPIAALITYNLHMSLAYEASNTTTSAPTSACHNIITTSAPTSACSNIVDVTHGSSFLKGTTIYL